MREPTVSVTHLVKQIAKEEYDNANDAFVIRLNAISSNLMNLQGEVDAIKSGSEIKIALQRAGDYWDKHEDELLVREVATALAVIANNHKRTIGAIKARISQRSLTNG